MNKMTEEDIITIPEVPTSDDVKRSARNGFLLPISILLSALIVAGALIYISPAKKTSAVQSSSTSSEPSDAVLAQLEQKITPSEGVILPVKWNDLGKQLVKLGVIDSKQFEQLYVKIGGLSDNEKKILYEADNGNIKITPQNSNILLNLLWALGLANKNTILENGPMTDPQYGGADGFASTGGWTIAVGDAMDHYSKHSMINLTPDQQSLVERVSKNIYRPCCGNSVYFPDCNHGMAMLGLLELMAAQGSSEQEIYDAALVVNSYWFPDTYLTIAKYLNEKGKDWDKTGAQKILSYDFSSQKGYKKILSEVEPAQSKNSGGACGV